jgi:hypothetical protein
MVTFSQNVPIIRPAGKGRKPVKAAEAWCRRDSSRAA